MFRPAQLHSNCSSFCGSCTRTCLLQSVASSPARTRRRSLDRTTARSSLRRQGQHDMDSFKLHKTRLLCAVRSDQQMRSVCCFCITHTMIGSTTVVGVSAGRESVASLLSATHPHPRHAGRDRIVRVRFSFSNSCHELRHGRRCGANIIKNSRGVSKHRHQTFFSEGVSRGLSQYLFRETVSLR